MELQFLGTGAGQPSKARNVSSLVLKLLDEINEVWMFDCGEGTQRQILETTIKPRKVKKIFQTASAKIRSRKGNSPDHQLRSQNNC